MIDLKTGMLVTTSDGQSFIVVKDTCGFDFLFSPFGSKRLEDVSDIIRIEAPPFSNIFSPLTLYQYTIWADDPEYGKKFASRYEKLLRRLYEENRYTPHICYAGNRLNIGIPTIEIRFRAINGKTDIGDIDTFRDSYIKSLKLVKNTIDIVREETDLL